MPSPFPGMNPYMEDPAVWPDFHGEFLYACREQLLGRLPAPYDAVMGVKVRLVEAGGEGFGIFAGPGAAGGSQGRAKEVVPDLALTADPSPAAAWRPAGGSTAVADAPIVLKPVLLPAPAYTEEADRWIEIVRLPDRELVTAVEVLSPTNKVAGGYGRYMGKRRSILREKAGLVEVDLLIGGRRLPLGAPLPPGDYFTFVTRSDRQSETEAYAWPLPHPLPAVPVPLRAGEADVPLDLAAAFAVAFDRGRYARRMRYDAAPPAPLSHAHRDWAGRIARDSAPTPG